jgi:hypothetical protein
MADNISFDEKGFLESLNKIEKAQEFVKGFLDNKRDQLPPEIITIIENQVGTILSLTGDHKTTMLNWQKCIQINTQLSHTVAMQKQIIEGRLQFN